MLTTEEYEQRIVACLAEAVDDKIAVVEPCPEGDAEYELLHPNGAILVRMNDVRASEPKGVFQTMWFEVELITAMRNLRSHTGAYTVMDGIRKGTTGLLLPGCSRLYQTSRKFLGKQDGVWVYGQTFEFRTEYMLGT